MPCACAMIAVLMPTTRPRAIDERPAGVAGIQRGGVLHDAFDEPALPAAQRAPERADDAGRNGGLEPERIADRDDELAHARCRVQQLRVRQAGGLRAQHGEIRRRIAPDDDRGNAAAIDERDARAIALRWTTCSFVRT